MSDLKWSFYQVWNESLENRSERKLALRNHIWAGELGGSFIDRYLKMKATPYTNPPNPRSLRKFEAGNMMEWVVGSVLKRAGILIPLPPLPNGKPANWLSFQYPDLLEVTGRLDFFAGGKPDWSKAKQEVESLGLPEFFARGTNAIIDHFSTTYPNGLAEVILEVKSCSSFMFERYEKLGVDKRHSLQLFHYLKAKNLPEGHVVYISKDDLRMLEFGVFNPSPTEEIYKKDIEDMTHFIKNSKEPEKEKEILFDRESGKFNSNWKVAYSVYLTKLYGYKDQLEFDTKFRPMVSQWNRVLGRCVKGDNMTPANLEIIEAIKKTFPNFDEYVQIAKEKGVVPEEEEKQNDY